MTCTKEQLEGFLATLEKEYDKIDGLKEQIKVIQKGPQGIDAEIKQFSKDYEIEPSEVKEIYKYYAKRQQGQDAMSDDYYTACVWIDEALGGGDDDEESAIDEYGNVRN